MLALIQRVTYASVEIEQQTVAKIQQGILALIGFEPEDTQDNAVALLERLLNYRLFSDSNGKMNLSLKTIQAELLLVPQFTLAANTQKGLRPSFSSALNPSDSQILFDKLQQAALSRYPSSQFGQFGKDMSVQLCNDGPVTFLLKG
jgi:D-tyrosyl-tRNA(Tyr) deacylase